MELWLPAPPRNLTNERESAASESPTNSDTVGPSPTIQHEEIPPRAKASSEKNALTRDSDIRFKRLFRFHRKEEIKPMKALNLDASLDDDDSIESNTGSIPKLAGKLAALCRHELALTYNVANVMVAREWLLRTMRARDIRLDRQVQLMPFALKYCFVPTKYEISARQMTLSDNYQLGRLAETTQFQRQRSWKDWFFGRPIVREPMPAEL